MKKHWSFFTTILSCILFIIAFTYRGDIINFVMSSVIQNKEVSLPNEEVNFNDFEFTFVQEAEDFHVNNRQDILNVLYTVLNHGITDFTFYCDKDYENCIDDFTNVSNDQVLLSAINNFVSPYNSYEKIYFKVASYGEISVSIDKLYSDEEKQNIENKLNEFEEKNINNNMSTRDKIKAFHDYLVNNSTYDKVRAKAIEDGDDHSSNNSHKATGPLIDGISLCSGYSDAVKIYLDKLGVPNYKISNANHIWNLVYLDGKWLHLDLTWDDPVTTDGSNILLYKFFLISTDELHKLDPKGHNFNTDYYPETQNS